MNVPERLKMLRENRGLSQEQLADALGVDRTTIVKYETGASKPTRMLQKLADFYHISTDELLGRDIPAAANVFPLTGLRRAPVLGSVRCGVGGLATQESGEFISIDDSYKNPSEIVGFRATGDSMEGDNIHDGDICLVRLMNDVEDGSIAVVVIDGEEGTLKRVRKQPNMIILEASNRAYPPRVFAGADANNVRIVGRVIEVRQKK